MSRIFISFCLLLVSVSAISQTLDSTQKSPIRKFSLSGYGAMNYYNFDWQTDTVKRNAIDNERFILDMKYAWTDKIRLNTEIEFEHGGTGIELEFDRFEEFGEFEFDVHQGGEVLVEQMNLDFSLPKGINAKIGRVKVPFALMFKRDEPTDYLTNVVSEAEMQILPENWTENGFLVSGNFGQKSQWKWHLALVNGLDNSAFNSANWIKRGNQRRFEMARAENFALVTRLDYSLNPALTAGFSFYGGNTTLNRPKPDLKLPGYLGLGEIHFLYKKDPFQIAAMGMYGALQNSEAITNQNRNLSNNLNVKRTPVGAAAISGFAELGLTLWGKNALVWQKEKGKGQAYLRADYYDTMFKTQGLIFNNPRWARHSFTGGVVVQIIPDVHFKAQYTLRKVGAPAPTSVNGGTLERTFIAGFAFEFD